MGCRRTFPRACADRWLLAALALLLAAGDGRAREPLAPRFTPDEEYRWTVGGATLAATGFAPGSSAAFLEIELIELGEYYHLWLQAGQHPPRVAAGVLGLAASPGTEAFIALAAVLSAQELHVWNIPDPNRIPPLAPLYLAQVRDGTPVGPWETNPEEVQVWQEAVLQAAQTSPAAFARHTRRDVTYRQVWEHPAAYRGQVIHGEGRLVRVRSLPVPSVLQAAGIHTLYEGYVMDRKEGVNPWCVVFTQLPAGVKEGDPVDLPASFEGYFFKRWRYKAGDSRQSGQGREIPMVIAPTLSVLPAPPVEAPSPEGWAYGLRSIVAGFVLGLLALVGLLTWGFRRADRRIQSRLSMTRKKEFVEPEPAPPEALGEEQQDLPNDWMQHPGEPGA